jgi:sortase A
MRTWISNFLLFFAGLGLGVWLASVVKLDLDQNHDAEVFDHERLAETTKPPLPAPAAPAPAAPAPAQGSVVGRLSIDRIHLQAMVREGDDAGTLDVALGHIPGTAFPGQKGNVGVAGHRDRLFSHLGELKPDDTIAIETPTTTYVYVVDGTQIVKPQDVGVLAPGPHDQLTLVTCYPFRYIGAAPKRYIVKAHLEAHNLGAASSPTQKEHSLAFAAR